MNQDEGAMQAGTAHRSRARRAVALVAAVALALATSGCGGAAVYVDGNGSGVALFVNVFLDGSSIGKPVQPGEPMTVTIQVGQPIEFDASGAVVWRFSVNGGSFAPAGSTVLAPGLSITVSPVGTSRVRVSTVQVGGRAAPANVTLTATSSLDQREVVTVHLQVR
jgi:hypothetical protein